MGSLAAAAADAAAGEPGAALKRLDVASIMGAPLELVRPFLLEVEPAARGTVAGDGSDCGVPGDIPDTLPPGAAAPAIERPLAELDASGSDAVAAFRREYMKADKSVLLRGLGAGWAATREWRRLGFWLGRFAHRWVPLEVGAPDDDDWHEEVATFAQFVERHMASDALCAAAAAAPRVGYLAQHPLFEQPGFDALAADFEVPRFCPPGAVQRVNVWMGSCGTVTPLHYDSYEGILAQVAGFKYVRLYAGSQSHLLYRTAVKWNAMRRWPTEQAAAAAAAAAGGGAQGTSSMVDVERPDLQRFPLFATAHYSEVLLGPGDAVYIPAGCWHYVRSLTRSISLNFIW